MKLTPKDIEFIAWHCNNVYPKKFKGSMINEHIVHFKDDNINGYTFIFNNTTYIIIAGTDELEDWFVNLNAVLVRADGESAFTRVHDGFYDAYKTIKAQIIKASSCTNRVVLAGHSLGGALATLAAFELAKINLKDDIHLVTFGSPRVGNYTFTRKFNKLVKNSYRFVNETDAVPRSPTVALLFRHVKSLYQNKHKFKLSWMFWRGITGDSSYHDMENYIDKLKKGTWKI